MRSSLFRLTPRPSFCLRLTGIAAAGAVIALLACGGCGPPDLGEAPFFCNTGTPECPDGYDCVAGKCLRRGLQAFPSDGGPPLGDGSKPPADGGPPDMKPPPSVLIHITEFLADPDAVTDADGEWIELFNPGAQGLNINGWTLKDKGQDSHVIAHAGPLIVPPKGYLILGSSTDKAKNGNVNVAYAYRDFFLGNSADEIILLNANKEVIDSVSYSKEAGFAITPGASLSLKNWGLDKTKPGSWCLEPNPWPGSKGDRGTPGFNPGCN